MQTNYSILNTVAAANADYGTFGSGGVKITGLPAYFKKDLISAPKTASTDTYVLDTNCTISGSGATLTWSAGTPDTATGEVLTVTKSGVTYLAAILTGTTGATCTVAAWLGANGTPADAAGYTVTRWNSTTTSPNVKPSDALIKVVFAAPAAVSNLTLGVKFTGLNAPTAPTNFRQWNYTSTATTSAADLQDSFYNWCNYELGGTGFYAAKVSTTTVVIYYPQNTFLSVTPVSASGYTAPTVTTYLPSGRLGYGADLIAKYGYPAASSSTANDGIVSTAFYTQYELNINGNSAAGVSSSVSYALLIATAATNASTLITYLDSNLI